MLHCLIFKRWRGPGAIYGGGGYDQGCHAKAALPAVRHLIEEDQVSFVDREMVPIHIRWTQIQGFLVGIPPDLESSVPGSGSGGFLTPRSGIVKNQAGMNISDRITYPRAWKQFFELL